MPSTMPLQCTCGTLRGAATEVSAAAGCRLVCMCDDCQTYAHFLERADDILDEHGGTEIYQMTPSQLHITQGLDQLRCVRLGPKGLMRWYAGCCNAPVGNTLSSAKVPFVGVVHTFMSDPRSRDDVLGPVRAKVQGRFCRGELPADAHARAPLGLMLRSVRLLLSAWLRGRQRPSPFFDAESGRPIAEPTVLPAKQREHLRDQATAPRAA